MKARYATLDAMRGVAALFVVARHFGPVIPPYSYLAVDVFFVLSGFVLAHAYDDRLAEGMTALEFLRARVARLYPLFALGLALGVISVIMQQGRLLDTGQVGAAAIQAVGFPSPWEPQPFPFNGVLWSLFFEFWVANILFALFWRQLQGAVLWALVSISAVGVVVAGLVLHHLDIGFRWSDLAAGVPRVTFSFFLGVALKRAHAKMDRPPSLPGWAVLALMALVFSIPIAGRRAHLYEISSVLVVLPSLVFLGAGAAERRPALGAALGNASYAAYTLHRPLLEMLGVILGAKPMLWLPAHVSVPAQIAAEVTFVALIAALGWSLDLTFDRRARRALHSLIARSSRQLINV